MNAYERTLATVRGEPRDRLSCQPIFMTFAARLAGISYRRYVTQASALVEAQLRLCETFEIDVVSCCSDAWREAHDCGTELRYFDEAPPACSNHLLADKSRLSSIRMPVGGLGPRMSDRVEAVARFRQVVGGVIPILGWVEGPVAEAADLRGLNELMLDTVDDLPFVLELFEFVTQMEIVFARAQVDAGADIIGIGDAAASLVSRAFYEEYALAFEQRIIDAVHEAGALVRLHVCGNASHLLECFRRLGPDLVDIDYPVPFAGIRERIGSKTVLLGNVDPVAVVRDGSPERIGAAVRACHREAGSRFMVGAGCEIPPDTPEENVRALVDYARSHE